MKNTTFATAIVCNSLQNGLNINPFFFLLHNRGPSCKDNVPDTEFENRCK